MRMRVRREKPERARRRGGGGGGREGRRKDAFGSRQPPRLWSILCDRLGAREKYTHSPVFPIREGNSSLYHNILPKKQSRSLSSSHLLILIFSSSSPPLRSAPRRSAPHRAARRFAEIEFLLLAENESLSVERLGQALSSSSSSSGEPRLRVIVIDFASSLHGGGGEGESRDSISAHS